MHSENFLMLVDDYVDSYYSFHPAREAIDGFHKYSFKGLDDVSQESIEKEIETINNFKRRLAYINKDLLDQNLIFDYEVLFSNIESRLYSLQESKIHKYDPYYYIQIIQNALMYQMIFDYAGSTLDTRFHTSLKFIESIPLFIDNAIKHLQLVPQELLDYGIISFIELKSFLTNDVTSVFSGAKSEEGIPADTILLSKIELANSAIDKMINHLTNLNNDSASVKPSFALEEKNLVMKLKYEQGIILYDTNPFEKILNRTLFEINKDKAAFIEIAQSINISKTPLENWVEVQTHHPVPGEVASVLTNQLESLKNFLSQKNIVALPEDETVVVKAAPQFMLYWYASLWQTGAFEPSPVPTAIYYASDPIGILKGENGQTDLDAQNEFLTAMITPELWSTSAHEAYPGHFLQGYYTKQVKKKYVDMEMLSKIPVSCIFCPFSYSEGWAHYTEQMIREEGFMENSDSITYKEYLLGQITDSLLRLCRTYAGIKMHLKEMSLNEAADFFENNAFIPREAAEVEAQRGTYDPDYILYSIGKLAILQLRDDYKKFLEDSGKTYFLNEFHERFLMSGQYPISIIRKKLIPGDNSEIIR
ncbi:DUF885 family protein [Candidatus Dependentiae bacterium]|nr:DUF885 family protein [Candidatus Dependentiae bacterium]